MSDNERLEQQFRFILEADKEKSILRQTLLSNGKEHENDADHAWHMALMCLLLSEYANEPIDVLRTISMILIHDVVEIDAGDTYAYDAQGCATQRERELKAADRLYSLLPPDQGEKLRTLWDEFEEGRTPRRCGNIPLNTSFSPMSARAISATTRSNGGSFVEIQCDAVLVGGKLRQLYPRRGQHFF